jgi:hypothetical protein
MGTLAHPRHPEGRLLGDLIADIAERVVRLSPDRRDPEASHIRKSDLAHELRALARRIGGVK